MKICNTVPGPVGKALSRVLFTVVVSADTACDEPRDADLVIVEDKKKLHELFDEEKFFAIFSLQKLIGLPENVRWISGTEFIPPMIHYLKHIETKLSASVLKTKIDYTETGKEFPPLERTEESQHILVVDDKAGNRQIAMDVLNAKHFVTLASGFGEGLRLINDNQYDVVLSDCQMPPETEGTALSIDNINVGQTVHNGIFIIFHATRKGARVAIVTDANHHADWVSALLDDRNLRQPQTVNGQPVLLINYMTKDWDKALEALNAI